MGKRFTETAKWADKWFRKLTPLHKLAWLYLCDNCDPAGVINLDRELADFQVGEPVDWDGFANTSDGRVEQLPKGRLWVTGFIAYQYPNGVSRDCKAHNPVFASLEKHGLEDRVSKQYPNSMYTPQDKDKDKDKDKRRGSVRGKRPPVALGEIPENLETDGGRQILEDWLSYKAERRETYKPQGLKAMVSLASNRVSEHGMTAFVESVSRAMANGWKGWDHFDTNGKTPITDREKAHAAFRARHPDGNN